MRSFVRDCYSFCRFSVLAPEPPPASQQADRQAGSSEAQQREQEQQQADEFVAAVLGDGDEPAAAGGDAAASAADEPAAAAGGREAAGRADGGSSGASAPSCSAAAAIWGLHPCPQASAEQPPALLAIPGGDERTAEIVCCACGARLAEFREQAAGRKLGMLMAVQLYCLPSAAAPAARGTAGDVACGAAAPSAPAGGGGGGSPSASGGSSSDAPPAAPSPRVCLAAGYEDGSLVLWDAAAPRAPLAQRQLCKEPVMALALHPSPCSPTGGACGSAEDAVAVFKLDHASCPAKIGIRHSIELRKEGIGDAAVRPDGKLLVTAGWDGRVRAYKYRSGRALAILKVGWDGGWDRNGGRCCRMLPAGGPAGCIAQTLSRRLGPTPFPLQYHTSPVTGLRFAPRSMLLATAARDGTLALWPLYQPGTERQ